MKKTIHICLTLILLLQAFMPQLVLAEAALADDSTGVVKAQFSQESQKEQFSLNLDLQPDPKNRTYEIQVSESVRLTEGEEAVNDRQGVPQGTVSVNNNLVKVNLFEGINSLISLSLKGEVISVADQGVAVTLADQRLTVPFPSQWLAVEPTTEEPTSSISSSAETDESALTTTEGTSTSEPLAEPDARRDPLNIKELYDQLGLSDDFLTDMTLNYTDAEGNPIENPTIDDIIHFSLAFSLSEEVRQLMEAGDYYEMSLPDTITITQSQQFELKDANGNTYANVTIGTDGKVRITFTDEIKHASEIEGECHFTGGFNKESIGGPGEITIIPPGHEDLENTVTIKPNYTGDNIDKKGHFDQEQNPDKIIWDVDVNKALDSLSNATVTESLPKGTIYESVKVYKVQVDFAGKVVPGSEVLADPSEYTVDADGTVHFKEMKDAYRLEYTTKIAEEAKPSSGGMVDFLNHASLTADDLAEATTEATVSGKYGSEITKVKGNYNSADQTIDWKLLYNYGEKTISNGTITDTFQDDQMFLVDGSVKLYQVTFDQAGNPQRGRELVEGTDYRLIKTADGFKIEFIGELNTAVDVAYKTGYDGIVDENTTINNAVVTDTGEEDHGSGNLVPQNVIKKLGKVDYNQHTAAWNIDVNLNHYSMNHWQLKDTLSDGLRLKTETFVIYDKDSQKNLDLGTDYTLDYDVATNVIKVVFIGNYQKTDHAFRVSYTTDYDPDLVSANDPDKYFRNTAQVDWETDDGDHVTDEDHADFKPNEPTKYNGSKSGSYNAKDKTITWTIAVNYGDQDIENAKLTDPISTDQQFVWRSLKIYHYTVSSSGAILKGAELSRAEYRAFGIQEPSATNNQTLNIDFPDGQAGQYVVEFKTSVAGQQIHETYDNDAVFSNDNYEDHSLHGQVTVNHGDEMGTKTGKQDDDGFVNWSVTLNGSQSTLYDVTVEDVPSANQAIDVASLHIFQTTVNQQGDISIDRNQELVKDQDYTVVMVTDNVTGQQKMTIKFINGYQQIEAPLIMEYKAMVFLEGNQGTVSNAIHITSEGKTETDTDTDGETEVNVTEGGGSSSGHRGAITLKKTGEDGKVLPEGATFELWDRHQSQLLRSGTVGQDGLITFGNLPYGDYLLKETGTLTALGYTIDQELVDGKLVTINEGTTAGEVLIIQNKLSQVQLIKQNEAGKRLAKAEFKLERYDQQTDSWLEQKTAPLISDQHGKLTIKGLTAGKYRLTETKAPAGYMVNSTPIPFEVIENQDHQLIQVGMTEPFINYQASLSFIKKTETGQGLQGATFGLYAQTNPNQLLAKATSGTDGKVLFSPVAPGTYQIKELAAPNGYLLNKQVLEKIKVPESAEGALGTIEIGQDLVNYQGSAEIRKYGLKQSEKMPLSGIEFSLEDSQGKEVSRGVTKADGTYEVTGLAPGIYYFKEISVGTTGYILNTEKVKVVIPENVEGKPEKVKVDMVNYLGSFAIQKVDGQGNPLVGAEFSLYTASRDLVAAGLTSDAKGMVTYEDLSPGKYYLVETKAPISQDGQAYVKNDYPIWLTVADRYQGKPELIELGQFQNFKGKIELTKKGQGKLPIAGAEFTLYRWDGQQESLVTDRENPIKVGTDGHINIDNLGPGNYKLVETKAPNGYVINTQPLYFVIREGEQTAPPVEEVSMTNYEVGIKARKVSEGHPFPVGLAGAEFEILDKAGKKVTVYDQNGQDTTTIISDQQGELTANGLGAGEYRLVEVKAPSGYILNTTPTHFVINDSLGEPEDLVVELGDIVNYQGEMEVIKADSQGRDLSGGEFEIRNDAGQVVSVIGQLGLETKRLVALDGMIMAKGLAPGRYSLVELKAPEGYIRESDEQLITFDIAEKGQGQANLASNTLYQGRLTNYQGSVRLTKRDNQTKATLTGAEFSLFTADGRLIKDQLVTNDSGEIVYEQLAPGNYYFRETKAPNGYQLGTENHAFTIERESRHQPEEIQLSVTNQKLVPVKKAPLPKGPLGQFGEAPSASLLVVGLLLIFLVMLLKRHQASE
ncbi:hypothetical protein I6N95_16915 [Vagococcus sp. BWB3-3]|uniref:FHA domain-containing protein n=1 Tax=Vagococcus allomyrinae TaxID=2794353 RepID=A0A940PDA2_9ENTE|nr:SpaA isopeptide-forming pilin-related protein [Vagococcus allomyrinae]MBP1042700.1 hypothetical protein [Vagococcus allomyrinae]